MELHWKLLSSFPVPQSFSHGPCSYKSKWQKPYLAKIWCPQKEWVQFNIEVLNYLKLVICMVSNWSHYVGFEIVKHPMRMPLGVYCGNLGLLQDTACGRWSMLSKIFGIAIMCDPRCGSRVWVKQIILNGWGKKLQDWKEGKNCNKYLSIWGVLFYPCHIQNVTQNSAQASSWQAPLAKSNSPSTYSQNNHFIVLFTAAIIHLFA